MNIFSSIISEVAKRVGYSKQPASFSMGSGFNISPSLKSSDYIAAYTGWVYANIKRRAEQFASTQIKLMRQKSEDQSDEVFDSPAQELLYRVNDQMTQRELLELTHVYLDLTGEAFWYLERGISRVGEPQAIIPLKPDQVRVVPEKLTGEIKGKTVAGFIYTQHNPDGTYYEIPLTTDNCIMFKEQDPNSMFRGKSIIQAAAQTIDTDDSQEKWGFKFFEQGATAKPMFETDQYIDVDNLNRLYAQLKEGWSGIENAHKPIILHSGLKTNTVGFTQRDMEFLQGQTWTRDKIMALFGMTKTILGITDDVNRANAETSEYVFAKYTKIPRVEKIVEYLNEFYLPKFKGTQNMFFVVDEEIPVDADKQRELYKAALAGASWMTQNEVRESMNLEPIEGGDKLFYPQSMLALGEERPSNNSNFQMQASHKPDRQKRIIAAFKSKKQLEQRIEEAVAPVAEAIVAKRTPQPNMKDFRGRALSKGGFHEVINKVAMSFEMRFKKVIQAYFEAQKIKVIQNVQFNYRKDAGKFMYDVAEAKTVGIKLVTPVMQDIMQKQGNEALFFIGSSIGFNVDNPRARNFVKRQAGKFIDQINETTIEKLRTQLDEGLEKGEGIPDLQNRVRSVFDNATDARAETIARTETIKATNFAAEEAYRQSGIVEAKEWLTAEDERTCEFCGAMDGKIVALDDEYFKDGDTVTVGGNELNIVGDVGYPPEHPNCRCTIIPVLTGTKGYIRHRHNNEGLTKKDLDKLHKKLDKLNDENA